MHLYKKITATRFERNRPRPHMGPVPRWDRPRESRVPSVSAFEETDGELPNREVSEVQRTGSDWDEFGETGIAKRTKHSYTTFVTRSKSDETGMLG